MGLEVWGRKARLFLPNYKGLILLTDEKVVGRMGLSGKMGSSVLQVLMEMALRSPLGFRCLVSGDLNWSCALGGKARKCSALIA